MAILRVGRGGRGHKELMKKWTLAGLVLAIATGWVHATPTLDDFLKLPDYASMTLSPGGDYLAARIPMDDRTVLVILRRSDMAVTATLNPGRDGFVDGEYWVSDTRLFASISMKFGSVEQPYRLGLLRSLDVDGRNGRNFIGAMIDPLVDDPDHVITYDCRKTTGDDCWTRAYKVDSDGEGCRREPIVDAPVANADFMADRAGTIRLSWAWSHDDRQQTFLLRAGQWQQINDESASGVEVVPLGTSYDRRYGYLRSERVDGPDVIERIDLETAERVTVASDPQRDPESLVWSFDGHEPIGAVYGGRQPGIRFFDEGHPHAALTRELIATFPGELAHVTSSSRDGRTALVTVLSDREPERFYLLDTASGNLDFIARSRPWLKPAELHTTDPITFASRDGLEIRGWLTKPSSPGRHPLVIMPHGGPYGLSDDWYYQDDVQMLAARGYAVLRVNFRGSGGRGRPFIEAGYRQWGAAMQDDVTDATHWAAAQADIDASRICLWGESYGAYAALMGAAREPTLYRCVIGMAGPYHLPTLYRWGDTHKSRYGRAYLDRVLGKDESLLLERSPTQHAKAIKADILLVQGMRDRRTSPEHLRAMRRSLDEAGKKYQVYQPSGEAHGIFGLENRRKYYSMVLEFLDRNLQPGGPATTPTRQDAASMR